MSVSLLPESLRLLDGKQEFLSELLQASVGRQVQTIEAGKKDRQADGRLALTKNRHVYWHITEVLFHRWYSEWVKSNLSVFEFRRKILQHCMSDCGTHPRWLLHGAFRHDGNSPCVASWKPSFLPHLVNAELLGTVTSWAGKNKRWVVNIICKICMMAIPS